MKAEGVKRSSKPGKLIAIGIVALAVIITLYTTRWSQAHPSTSDASLDADVVHVAAGVGGRVIEIGTHENAWVRRGTVLFRLDPVPYHALVAQAKADLALARAQLDTQRRAVFTQRSNATLASKQIITAQANYDLATRTADRLRPLSAQGYVPHQQLDVADVNTHDAATRLEQARVQKAAAQQAVDTVQAGESAVAAREAALALATRNLEDTSVQAAHDGYVVGLSVSTGEFVLPGQTLFTLINTEDWFAVANLRETELQAVQSGDCATVYSMIDRRTPVAGHVEGIGWGVADQDRINLSRSVPYVERSLNWVRVAQRFPVRIRLESAPQSLMRLGASAVVQIRHGSECH